MRCKPGLKVSPKAEKQNWYFFVNGIIFSLDFFLYRHFEGPSTQLFHVLILTEYIILSARESRNLYE
jgi:hypothetical protein